MTDQMHMSYSTIYARIERECELKPITTAKCNLRTSGTLAGEKKRLGEVANDLVFNMTAIKRWGRKNAKNAAYVRIAESYYEQQRCLHLLVVNYLRYLNRVTQKSLIDNEGE